MESLALRHLSCNKIYDYEKNWDVADDPFYAIEF
jgi:hypothetical protein